MAFLTSNYALSSCRPRQNDQHGLTGASLLALIATILQSTTSPFLCRLDSCSGCTSHFSDLNLLATVMASSASEWISGEASRWCAQEQARKLGSLKSRSMTRAPLAQLQTGLTHGTNPCNMACSRDDDVRLLMTGLLWILVLLPLFSFDERVWLRLLRFQIQRHPHDSSVCGEAELSVARSIRSVSLNGASS